MKRNLFRALFSSLVLVAVLSLAGDAFAQGRGKGNGKGGHDKHDKRGDGGDNFDRGNRGNGNNRGQMKKQEREFRNEDRRESRQFVWQDRRNDRGRELRDDRRVIYQQRQPGLWAGFPNPRPVQNYERQRQRAYWRENRKEAREFWKDERKREKQAQKFWRRVDHDRDKQDRRYWRDQRRAYNDYREPAYSYNTNYYPEYRNGGRGGQIIQVITGILGGGSPVYFDNTPQYSYYQRPAYNVYQPRYVNYSQYDPYQYDNDQYGYDNGYENNGSSLLGLLPDEFSSGLIGQLLSNFLGSAYGRGYDDALFAQDYGYDQPYATTSYANYIPAVVSNDQARQIFNEGYELGYRDAIASNESNYGQGIGGTGLDLVNLFLNNSLSL